MSRTLKQLTISLITIAGVAGFIGCGSGASNNDQGTSVTATGYFFDSMGEIGLAGVIFRPFLDTSVYLLGPNPEDTAFGAFDGQAVNAYLGVQNRLISQFVRIVRIDCDYSVPGSFIDIPSNAFPVGLVLNETGGQLTTGINNGVVNETTEAGESIGYIGFLIVNPDLVSFLNNNQDLLPQLPYRVIAECSATGVTQAGDTITTNSLALNIQMSDSQECCTGSDFNDDFAFQVGPGSGGTLITSTEEEGALGVEAFEANAPEAETGTFTNDFSSGAGIVAGN